VTVSILLADDHPIVRQGLHHLLENESNFQVIGEAGDGLEAVAMVDRLQPDVLVVDMMMPGLNGLEVIRQALKRQPNIRVIVLSMQSADAYLVEALKSGASGYVLKETGPSELVRAVHEVIKGNQYISPKLSERLSHTQKKKVNKIPIDPYESLTDREREILQMAAEGRTSTQIAQKLSISPRTAELHRSHMMKKLGLHNQMDVLRYALKRGILPMDD
jgi:DNA-binding NarL/FixJ family response regulator